LSIYIESRPFQNDEVIINKKKKMSLCVQRQKASISEWDMKMYTNSFSEEKAEEKEEELEELRVPNFKSIHPQMAEKNALKVIWGQTDGPMD
jgi:hypothetical protein